jgi:integrating conjugative element protein (TIGR03746 family)
MAEERARMSEPRNAINARDSHIWTLRMALVMVSGIALAMAGILYSRQNDFFLHVPPDLSNGANIKPGELQAPNAYAFASFVWRGLNDWPNAGKSDYPTNIKKYGCYVTPTFFNWIAKNEKEKNEAGELGRTRSLSHDDAFANEMVNPIGNNVFEVALTTRVHERIEGLPIKDIIVRYPLRVVADTRPCNRMGMALDGFYAQPERTEPEQVSVEKK